MQQLLAVALHRQDSSLAAEHRISATVRSAQHVNMGRQRHWLFLVKEAGA
jgi:hypothetical protein